MKINYLFNDFADYLVKQNFCEWIKYNDQEAYKQLSDQVLVEKHKLDMILCCLQCYRINYMFNTLKFWSEFDKFLVDGIKHLETLCELYYKLPNYQTYSISNVVLELKRKFRLKIYQIIENFNINNDNVKHLLIINLNLLFEKNYEMLGCTFVTRIVIPHDFIQGIINAKIAILMLLRAFNPDKSVLLHFF
ncbi:hypothetical protein EDEG_02794 [Edhazardia aedis USNM 41457]|uniref:Uncharacterized protein n=1 Tax=Edhazardia aedis (strain USNM 41457) TaxID=1003232 RepID=J9DJM1_EDHAE|nr:hypothetical protein EDEG_02794 [Edhazardia aedis USNM 41457]|eukprot:EJW02820.1 hypothetical protein EDEG_02794 [Edhazardia aedis USNM 41457]